MSIYSKKYAKNNFTVSFLSEISYHLISNEIENSVAQALELLNRFIRNINSAYPITLLPNLFIQLNFFFLSFLKVK